MFYIAVVLHWESSFCWWHLTIITSRNKLFICEDVQLNVCIRKRKAATASLRGDCCCREWFMRVKKHIMKWCIHSSVRKNRPRPTVTLPFYIVPFHLRHGNPKPWKLVSKLQQDVFLVTLHNLECTVAYCNTSQITGSSLLGFIWKESHNHNKNEIPPPNGTPLK